MLETYYTSSKIAPRFTALSNLLSIEYNADEPLVKFGERIAEAGGQWRRTWSAAYTIEDLAGELYVMSAVRNLPQDRSNVIDKLLEGSTIAWQDVMERFRERDDFSKVPTSTGETLGAATARPPASSSLPTPPTAKYCVFHKSTTHDTSDCKVLRAAEAQTKQNKKQTATPAASPSTEESESKL